MNENRIHDQFSIAKEQYSEIGVDVEKAITRLQQVAISLHCWQGDDVGGFENPDASLSGGGIAVTGNYPGKARTPDELRQDLEQTYKLIPGKHRLNLHAIYGDFGEKRVDRNEIEPKHFATWIDWAKHRELALDFNATLFSHPKAADGFTLSHRDPEIRAFWQEHVQRCREIGATMGRELKSPCLHNLWIPDGSKDLTVSRLEHREYLKQSLLDIYGVAHPKEHLLDSVESKLFGIGSESYVVGSHDFYLGWTLKHGQMLCLDLGHYHPTESVADKLSALLPFMDRLLLHVSRPVRWDSDHVVIFNDDLRYLMEEIVRADALSRVHLALDFFDAELNRIGAWVIGVRATLKALLSALLEPTEALRNFEKQGDAFSRLALLEEYKSLPLGAVWDEYCIRQNVAPGSSWMSIVKDYETRVLSKR